MLVESDCTVLTHLDAVAIDATKKYPALLNAYVNNAESLKPFNPGLPRSLENLLQKAESRLYPHKQREDLQKILLAQYKDLLIEEKVKENLESLLKPNTFTVTTGHQLVLYTGPLYFIYKIATVVSLAEAMKAEYPHLTIVPVYWMATEDHDYEEISEVSVFGKKHKWLSTEKGPVGYYNPKAIAELLAEINGFPAEWAEAYASSQTLAEATRKLVNMLFGKHGVIVIDASDKEAKEFFKPLVIKELTTRFSYPAVNEQTAAMEEAGFHSQIFPRETNLFYAKPGIRERLVFEADSYSVKNTDLQFSMAEILALAESNPEHFSPNVVLRPVYQEMLLPNIAYIGGPAEIAYWMQLGKVFEDMQMDMPLLIPRHFALIMPKKPWEKWQKSGLDLDDMMLSEGELKDKYLKIVDTDATDNWQALESQLTAAFDQAAAYAKAYDPTLVGMVQAELAKSINGLNNIQKRSIKAREQKFATEMNQIIKIQQKLFPDGGLQERSDNILSFLPDCQGVIDCLVQHIEPLDYRFHVWQIG